LPLNTLRLFPASHRHRFAADHVPLVPGENLITATATDIEANTLSAATVVISDGVESPLRLLANPESGVAPMEVKFSVLTTLARPITGVALDADGNGVADFSSTALPESILFTYTQPGLYYATILLTDDQGLTYSDTITVNVLSLTELDAQLKIKWEGMRNALRQGDVEKTLTYFTYGSQEKYRKIFNAIGANLTEEAQNLPDVALVTFYGAIGKYRIQRTIAINGLSQTLTYWVYFIQDTDGIWRIKQF
jgi:PKD repeat protein